MIDARRYRHLGAILEDAFLTWPSEDACIQVHRDREEVRLTFRETRERVHRVAAWLAAQGVGPDTRVALAAANQHGWLVSAAAAYRLGAVVVPLDAKLTPRELDALLTHCGADVLVTDGHLAAKLTAAPATVLVLQGPAPDGTTPFETACAPADAPPMADRTRDDLAAIVYSSGTGGDPKGCLLTHGTYLAQYGALTEVFQWNAGERYLSILPTNHAIDFMCGFIASWCTGTTVVHQRSIRPEHLMATMRRYRPDQMAVVPLVLQAFRRSLQAKLDDAPPERKRLFDGLTAANRWLTQRAPRHDVSRWLLKPVHDAFGGNLRTLYCGGAFTPPDLVRFFADLGLPVAVGYGLTEACTVVAVNDLHPIRDDSVGAPIPGVEVRIVDAGADGVGEVQVRGPTVFAGYLDDPTQTAEAFDGDWLRTGDLGWIDGAHHLHLVGRRKNVIVTPQGKNIYPEDVEHAFEGLDVEELCVVAADFVWPRRGLEGEQLVAVVRPRGDRDALREDLTRANRKLPDVKRLGGVLWVDEAFPRTTSLKVQRGRLAEQIREAHDRDAVEAL